MKKILPNGYHLVMNFDKYVLHSDYVDEVVFGNDMLQLGDDDEGGWTFDTCFEKLFSNE